MSHLYGHMEKARCLKSSPISRTPIFWPFSSHTGLSYMQTYITFLCFFLLNITYTFVYYTIYDFVVLYLNHICFELHAQNFITSVTIYVNILKTVGFLYCLCFYHICRFPWLYISYIFNQTV